MSKRKITQYQLDKILDLNRKYYVYPGIHGIHGEIANLDGMNLSGLNFSDSILNGASMQKVNLQRANLTFAQVHDTDLTGTNLTDAKLTSTSFAGADLSRVVLTGHELRDIWSLTGATIPARFLPWISTHPHFSGWLPTLTIVDD